MGPNQFFGNDEPMGQSSEARAIVKSEFVELYVAKKTKVQEICEEYGIENEFCEVATIKEDWHQKLQGKINNFLSFSNKLSSSIPKIHKNSSNLPTNESYSYGKA